MTVLSPQWDFLYFCIFCFCLYTDWFVQERCNSNANTLSCTNPSMLLVCDLNRTPIVMAKHWGLCVHFSGISTCGRTSRDTVSHPQYPPLPTLCKISLPVYIIVTNEGLQPLTTTRYNSPVLSFPLLKIQRRLIKHRTFLRALHSLRERP